MITRVSAPLPEGFSWQVENQRRTLVCQGRPIVEIGPERQGWMARILVSGKGISQEQVAVRSLEAGAAWATRWMLERQSALIRAVAELPPVS
ncbi:MAG TPA: hypothetical protein VJ766_13400 [Pseudoxanthomonas sp.]|uniref:hypothetical protein n=1 Tax=Pseudoxanthomonas sp. SE1 TaxID=1664560 RepID=UPI00240CEF65|nr:hypothetical protein [Pseudoxanthomonas sp. SE1]WFC40616.1 hypothetical protein OY559_12400 [Pseudoxanthomonas sp. SE1]HJS36475.1 hypothetical protein [Pseudoxanthomonas sp.]